ncbi:MAG: MBL fold metallo-hydrolase [Bacteroidetes bacterium]|jgi:metallo-beta-lactamase family protein|nr:MBL fold metallo-hydrolase [Bacteroidota bacterium]
MRIQFWGAARTVTGSRHLLSVNGSQVLLDCGLYQGRRQESYERNKNFPFDPASVHAVVLSHAHADHAGNLPNLVRSGFTGTIHTTAATRDLCNVMLYDSAYIQVRDVQVVNRIHRKKGLPPVDPLYLPEDVTATMEQIASVAYRRTIPVADGVRITFHDAGHILGSAVTAIDLSEQGRSVRLGFTGDLGRKAMPILKDPEPMGDADVLICESTYGGRQHESRDGMKERLAAVIKATADRGGKVIVPAFSLGRTQEFVYILFELLDAGLLPSIPVYVDSPLAVNATEVFRMHPECFDQETLALLHRHEDPFGWGRLRYVRSVDESKALNTHDGPCVIISASGMCEAGRVLHHLANSVGDPKNTVLIISYQAEHTLGRRLVDRAPEVKIMGDVYPVRAQVTKLNAFSAHAGQDELVEYVSSMDLKRLRTVALVHGEPTQAEQLKAALEARGVRKVVVPDVGDTLDLT